MEVSRGLMLAALLSTLSLLVGCDASSQGAGPMPGSIQEPPPAGIQQPQQLDEGHDHEHPSEGPHHGVLIELGDEEYHAELLHDERYGVVTIFILDGTARKSVPIEGSVVINAMYRRQPVQFPLAAVRGDASQFQSDEPALTEALDDPRSNASLRVTIDGRMYSGKLPVHDHGHDHNHDHGHQH